jgi:hypothetical protein
VTLSTIRSKATFVDVLGSVAGLARRRGSTERFRSRPALMTEDALGLGMAAFQEKGSDIMMKGVTVAIDSIMAREACQAESGAVLNRVARILTKVTCVACLFFEVAQGSWVAVCTNEPLAAQLDRVRPQEEARPLVRKPGQVRPGQRRGCTPVIGMTGTAVRRIRESPVQAAI